MGWVRCIKGFFLGLEMRMAWMRNGYGALWVRVKQFCFNCIWEGSVGWK